MCGIAGGIALRPGDVVDPDAIARMSAALAHRGPDGQGIWRSGDGRACLAHRRLSVIDLATGQQPMADPATGAVVVFNGEIYNYLELRAGMEGRGIRFRTASDTEVLLRLYLERGSECLSGLRGMFAFAIWDPRSARLFAARDRIGKKPLYYAADGERLVFASTFGAVRAALDRPVDVDPERVREFLALGYVPAPRTIDRRISKLEAGTWLVADADGLRTGRYWDIADDLAPFRGTREEALDGLDEMVSTAVRIRLRSDVPLGVFLSGGIDSSLVAAVAARQSPGRIMTFSVGFDEPGFDERRWAARIAGLIATDHHEFETRFHVLDLLPDVVRHYGEPFGDPSALPIWLLSEETRRHVTVAVGGDGGDEGFAGYDWYRTDMRLRRLRRLLPPPVRRAGAAALAATGAGFGTLGRLARAAALLEREDDSRFVELRSFVDPLLARHLYDGPLAVPAARVRRGPATGGSGLTRMQVEDVRTYLADCLMPKLDVATMAHGLEARAPLLDHEVLRFALTLPPEWLTDARTGKKILRDLAARYLPAEVLDRPKQGFDVPIASWFMRQLRPLIDRLPASPTLGGTGWFRAAGLRRLVDEHLSGGRDHSQRLYNFLMLEEWLKQA